MRGHVSGFRVAFSVRAGGTRASHAATYSTPTHSFPAQPREASPWTLHVID